MSRTAAAAAAAASSAPAAPAAPAAQHSHDRQDQQAPGGGAAATAAAAVAASDVGPLLQLVEHITCKRKQLPHLAWTTPALHTSHATAVVPITCFHHACCCAAASDGPPDPGRRAVVTRVGERRSRCLVAKLFFHLTRRRLVVHSSTAAAASPPRDDEDEDGGSEAGGIDTAAHWVMLQDRDRGSHTLLCDAFTLEALVGALVAARGGCWAHHTPLVLNIFVHEQRDTGVVVCTHEGMPLHHWLATGSAKHLQILVFQVAAALHTLQTHLCFSHNDLHDFNVLVTSSVPPGGDARERPQYCHYLIGGLQFWLPFARGLCARIIDFQFASVLLPHSGVLIQRADGAVSHETEEEAEAGGHSGGARKAEEVAAAAATPACNPLLSGAFGSDLLHLVRCIQRALPRSHSTQAFLRKCLAALEASGSVAAGTTSRVRPRIFLQRVFGGVGKFAVADFTRPPRVSETAVVRRMACAHTS